MSYARILVNGDELLEYWNSLAADQPRKSPEARETLIDRLTQFHDVEGTPLTVVFDEIDPFEAEDENANEKGDDPAPPAVEILYTQKRQRVEQALERALRRFRSIGEVRVIGRRRNAAPNPEEEAGCREFIQEVEDALRDLENQLNQLQQNERPPFGSTP